MERQDARPARGARTVRDATDHEWSVSVTRAEEAPRARGARQEGAARTCSPRSRPAAAVRRASPAAARRCGWRRPPPSRPGDGSSHSSAWRKRSWSCTPASPCRRWNTGTRPPASVDEPTCAAARDPAGMCRTPTTRSSAARRGERIEAWRDCTVSRAGAQACPSAGLGLERGGRGASACRPPGRGRALRESRRHQPSSLGRLGLPHASVAGRLSVRV